MYTLLYHPRAVKFLQKLPKKESDKIIKKMEFLRKNPFAKSLDIKKLATTKRSYRLRLGTIRIIFEVDREKKFIYCHEIDFRGNIY